jgi:uncharacterized protein YggE
MDDDFVLYIIVLVAVIIFSALIAFSFESNTSGGGAKTPGGAVNTTLNQLSVTASGTVYNTSTQSNLYVDINGTGQTNQQAVQNISASLNSFNSTILKFISNNQSRITTTSFQVYKIYNRSGYQATESLNVVIPNITNTSAVIGALSAIPNVFVTQASPQLSAAQITTMRTQALRLASANATSQATALIGKNNTIYATNISINNYYVYPYTLGVASAGPGGSAPSITPNFYGGTNKVTESVTVVFAWGPSQKK